MTPVVICLVLAEDVAVQMGKGLCSLYGDSWHESSSSISESSARYVKLLLNASGPDPPHSMITKVVSALVLLVRVGCPLGPQRDLLHTAVQAIVSDCC